MLGLMTQVRLAVYWIHVRFNWVNTQKYGNLSVQMAIKWWVNLWMPDKYKYIYVCVYISYPSYIRYISIIDLLYIYHISVIYLSYICYISIISIYIYRYVLLLMYFVYIEEWNPAKCPDLESISGRRPCACCTMCRPQGVSYGRKRFGQRSAPQKYELVFIYIYIIL